MNKKEWSFDLHDIDESQDNYAEWKQSNKQTKKTYTTEFYWYKILKTSY